MLRRGVAVDLSEQAKKDSNGIPTTDGVLHCVSSSSNPNQDKGYDAKRRRDVIRAIEAEAKGDGQLTCVRSRYACHSSTVPFSAGLRSISIASWSIYWIDFQIGVSGLSLVIDF